MGRFPHLVVPHPSPSPHWSWHRALHLTLTSPNIIWLVNQRKFSLKTSELRRVVVVHGEHSHHHGNHPSSSSGTRGFTGENTFGRETLCLFGQCASCGHWSRVCASVVSRLNLGKLWTKSAQDGIARARFAVLGAFWEDQVGKMCTRL